MTLEDTSHRAIAIVGLGAVLPDAPDVAAFWRNIQDGRYSIREVDPQRWDPARYWDPDPAAPDKTYSKIGGWVRDWAWDPVAWHLPVPPKIAAAMDDGQKWGVACTHAALADYGWPKRPIDPARTAIILGNAMAGERHYYTALRIFYPELAAALEASPDFVALPEQVKAAIAAEAHAAMGKRLPPITEDTMPGELSNCIAGRIANLFDFHGPNYVVDAACASAMAAFSAAVDGLVEEDFDLAVTGGIDRNMGVNAYVKFSKIGALSATGTRPYADGADGFVMGEGAGVFLLKRLADAERDGDRIYAVIRGIGGASDGKGKGITAPNPVGQKLAVQRAWRNAQLSPATVGLIEGHGTSTKVGDVVEVSSLVEAFGNIDRPQGSIPLGSVKSNIGHLKGAAGAAGLLKATLALHHKVLPPSLNWDHPNPNLDWAHSAFAVNTTLRPWETKPGQVRSAGVSAFGFGGTNFHVVLEEHVPGRLDARPARVTVPDRITGGSPVVAQASAQPSTKTPLGGAVVVGAESPQALTARLQTLEQEARAGKTPPPIPPSVRDLTAKERVAIAFTEAKDLAERAAKAQKAMVAGASAWKALRAQGVFRGAGAPPKVAFLYTGQGSQYVNMLRTLRDHEPLVAQQFAECDRIMTPLLGGHTLSELIFVDGKDPAKLAAAEEALKQTAITQPAVLATDLALTRLLGAYGMVPDMVMGHSLGEYGALVAAGALPFEDALEAVSARGREMTAVHVEDCGAMAAVFAPLAEVEKGLATISGYVVIANINSRNQSVIGGATAAVEEAMALFGKAGFNVVRLPVSHAFHTSIVAPASEPLRRTLERLHLRPPVLPVVANVTGQFYPMGPESPALHTRLLDLLGRQVASPVQFVRGLETLYDAGARVFVEVGPKRALHGFVEDVLGDRGDVLPLFTNHPKTDDRVCVNEALCGLWSAGLGLTAGAARASVPSVTSPEPLSAPSAAIAPAAAPAPAPAARANISIPPDRYAEVGRMFAEFLERSRLATAAAASTAHTAPVVITGAGLGLPGGGTIFDDANVGRLLHGEQFIDVVPTRFRRAILDKHITRLVKSDEGGASYAPIDNASEVIRLAARGGRFDLEKEYGVSSDRMAALDVTTRLAIAAGLDALRDAGIPLVLRYKTTSKGSFLPDRYLLPEALRDDTGVIFASAFPGYDALASEMERYHRDRSRREQLAGLQSLLARTQAAGESVLTSELTRRIAELEAEIAADPVTFDRRFLFRILAMGHSQFAELIGARGPNTQVNAACASTTQAVALAEDWIRAGRCRRVIVVAGDDVTSDNLLEWMGAGFLATGAAATDDQVENAALPFDRRRHGMLLGMGAAALVVESDTSARERGLAPICEVLGATIANSAFHGTRLDVDHIGQVMEGLVAGAEARSGVRRGEVAAQMVFVSHETYTPARGGSAAAEVHALRRVFGVDADRIVMANTKGYTGHPMGVGIEDVLAVKALETGLVPPIPNFREVDPELGPLNLSRGGSYPVEYALRLGAGFGSQIAMVLLRRVPAPDGKRHAPNALGFGYRVVDASAHKGWLARLSGQDEPALETVHRTLRVKDAGPPRGTGLAAHPAANGHGANGHAAPARSTIPVVVPAQPTATMGPPAVATVARAPSPAPVAPPPPAPPIAAPPPPPVVVDRVRAKVLEIVAEKTGYATDMLDLDLDLEADLGVDTVKQADTFAAVRAAFDIPREANLKLRDFPTLNHVIGFVYTNRPDLKPSAAPPAAAPVTVVSAPIAPAPVAAAVEDRVRAKVLEIVADKTGYATDMLDLDLDLEADLGVDTVKQADTFAAVRAAFDIPREANLKLRDFPTLNHVIGFVYTNRPDLRPAAPAAEPAAHAAVEVAPPAPVAAPVDDPVRAKVLEIVADKTGYATDMLDLDLDLEADLGVDTVKQADTFAAVRAAFDIPREATLKLRDFPTLNHVIGFVYTHRPELRPGAQSPAPAAVVTTPVAVTSSEAAPATAPTGGIPRRVAVPVPRPPLDLCKPSACRLEAGERVAIFPDEGGVAEALAEALRTRGVEVLLLDRAAERPADAIGDGPLAGLYWLAALDDEGDWRALSLPAWRAALELRVKRLYTTAQPLYARLAEAGHFLISATRLGGRHGYDEAGATSALGGAVTGFTKALHRELPAAHIKAVDFEAALPAAEIARLLIEETLADPGAVEIGYRGDRRAAVGLRELPAADGTAGLTLDRDTVFVITGAAGSIVAAITADLAGAARGGTFHLLDLAPEPDPGSDDLRRFRTDREGLKRDLFERIKARGERATPALVERELAALERQEAALSAIESIRRGGGTVHYHRVDLRDADAVAAALAGVRAGGRADVVLHAAGLEISHKLPDKPRTEFDLIFDVKSDGWRNVMAALDGCSIAATVGFSSIAGRFGNAGQCDYSAANDLLCKMASNLRRGGSTTRGIAIDWTAWASIGMASRGSIPKVMEAVGIGMLAPADGVPFIRKELQASGFRGEIVAAGALGRLLDEQDESGGLDGAKRRGTGVMATSARALTTGGELVVEAALEAGLPFLDHHRIDGTPVLPGVMGIESFVEAATLLPTQRSVQAIEEVDFLAPFKLYRDQPRTATVTAALRELGEAVVADCRLDGTRALAGQDEPTRTTHFTGRVVLGDAPPALPDRRPLPARPGEGATGVVGAEDLYSVYFHGPAYRVLGRAWTDGDSTVGELLVPLPADLPDGAPPLRALPRLVELCFQTAGLREMRATGRMALPRRIERLVLHRPEQPLDTAIVAVARDRADGGFDCEVLDVHGDVVLRLEGYRTSALPAALDPALATRLQGVG